MAKFSILVITYNRPQLLKECLNCLKEQTFDDFECYVLDRGSEPPVKNIVENYDKRFHYIRSSQSIHIVDGANEVIKNLNGEYFFHLADDDVICKTALEEVKNAFDIYTDCDVVQVGMLGYDIYLNPKKIDYDHFSRHSIYKFDDRTAPKYTVLNGKSICEAEWACFNILLNTKDKKNIKFTRLYPSTLFFKTKKLKKETELHGGAFLKPMWDIGTHILIYKSKLLYINKPLSIVSENTVNRESLSYRNRWKKEKLEFIPYNQVVSIDSVFVETIIKLIKVHKINSQIFLYPVYYLFVFCQILRDNPVTKETLLDGVIIAFAIVTQLIRHPIILYKERNIVKQDIKFFIKKQIKSVIKRFIKINKNKNFNAVTNPNFDSITQYRKFVESKWI